MRSRSGRSCAVPAGDAIQMREVIETRFHARHGWRSFSGGQLAGLLAAAGFSDVALERDCPHLFASAHKTETA